MDLISMRDAAKLGVERIRVPNWASPLDHIKIDIIEGGELGPWVHLYSPVNKWLNVRDPIDIIWALGGDADRKSFAPYTGPLSDSDEYQAAVERFMRSKVSMGAGQERRNP